MRKSARFHLRCSVLPPTFRVLLGFLWVKLGGRGRRLRCPGGGSAPGAGSPQPRRCLHPAPSRSRAPVDPSQTLRAKRHRDPSLDREPPGRVREGSTGRPGPAPADAPRLRRPAPTGRDLASWIVVGAAAIHGETPPWHARLTWSLPNVGSTRARHPDGLTRSARTAGRLIHLTSNEGQDPDRHTLPAAAQRAESTHRNLRSPTFSLRLNLGRGVRGVLHDQLGCLGCNLSHLADEGA